MYPLCSAAVAALSLIPNPPEVRLRIALLDKIEHALAYMALGFLGTLFFERLGASIRRAALIALAAGLVFGVAIEFIQPFVGRSCELADGIVDLAGLLVGCAVFAAASKKVTWLAGTPRASLGR